MLQLHLKYVAAALYFVNHFVPGAAQNWLEAGAMQFWTQEQHWLYITYVFIFLCQQPIVTDKAIKSSSTEGQKVELFCVSTFFPYDNHSFVVN